MPDRGCRQGARALQTRWMLAAVVVSVLSGCMVGPDYQRPGLPSPAVFRGTPEPAAPPDPTSLGDLRWFEVFQDAQLQALIQTALVANYDLRMPWHGSTRHAPIWVSPGRSSSLTLRRARI